MIHNYRLKLKTLNKDVTLKSTRQLVTLFKKPPFNIEKYDRVERAKKEFAIENIGDIHEHLKCAIMLKGKSKNLNASISARFGPLGIMLWTFFLKTSKPLTADFLDIVTNPFLQEFQSILPVLYGNCSSDKEHSWLHDHITYYDGGGSSEGWKGCTMDDFLKFLPGIYWYNFFGSELVNALGADKVKAIKDVSVTAFKNGSISFHLNEPADTDDLGARATKLYSIADSLGR